MSQSEKDVFVSPKSGVSEDQIANSSSTTMENSVKDENSIDRHEYLSGLKLFAVMTSITLASFLMLLDSSIVGTAIPQITGQFHSLEDVGWYGTAYLLADCAIQPLTGKIYSYFNVKTSFLAFFALFELGSALCGAATSSKMLILGRAVSGMGASGLLNGSYTVVASIVPMAKQAPLRGIVIGLAFFGLLGGPLIGGALTERVNWRWCFLINLPIGGPVALLLLFVSIPDYRKEEDKKQSVLEKVKKLDLPGFFLFAPTVIMLLLALEWGGTKYAWKSATVIGLFCGSFGNLLLFLAWEHRVGAEAMIPLHLLKNRIVWSSCLNMGFFISYVYTMVYYFPIYFQAVKGASPIASGVDFLPQILMQMVTTIVAGGLVPKVGYYLPFAVVGGVFTSIGCGLISTLTPTTAVAKRVGFQIIQGFQGIGFQIPILAVHNAVSREDVSVATALVVFSQNLSGAIFISIAQVIFTTKLEHGLAVHAPEANAAAIIAAGAAAVDVRNSVSADLLPGVLLAYSNAFDATMYLAAGSAVAGFIAAFGMGWKRIKSEEEEEKEKPAAE